jgi:hypothetical protein
MKGAVVSVLNRIAYFQDRRDEVPNQELARDLCEKKDHEGIREIAENLWNKDKRVQADCIKVLYEIGYIDPSLIADYVEDFFKLLRNRNNRMVWGGMTALSTIATLKANVIFQRIQEIYRAIEQGSVIIVDGGVLTLARVASTHEEHRQAIFPYLLNHIKTCRPKDVPQHSEKSLLTVNVKNKNDFIAVLEKRMEDLTDRQMKRVRKVIKEAENR